MRQRGVREIGAPRNSHPRCTNRCTKTSQRIPISPTVADYRTCNLLILRVPAVDRQTVTAEVASSSLVVPAIFFSHLQQTQKKIWVRLGPISDRSTPPAAHSLERILERALQHQLLYES